MIRNDMTVYFDQSNNHVMAELECPLVTDHTGSWLEFRPSTPIRPYVIWTGHNSSEKPLNEHHTVHVILHGRYHHPQSIHPDAPSTAAQVILIEAVALVDLPSHRFELDLMSYLNGSPTQQYLQQEMLECLEARFIYKP